MTSDLRRQRNNNKNLKIVPLYSMFILNNLKHKRERDEGGARIKSDRGVQYLKNEIKAWHAW